VEKRIRVKKSGW